MGLVLGLDKNCPLNIDWATYGTAFWSLRVGHIFAWFRIGIETTGSGRERIILPHGRIGSKRPIGPISNRRVARAGVDLPSWLR